MSSIARKETGVMRGVCIILRGCNEVTRNYEEDGILEEAKYWGLVGGLAGYIGTEREQIA